MELAMEKILFVCEKNSARSQIAEALINFFYGSKYEAYSAGIKPAEVNKHVIKALMKYYGIDISNKRSKSIDEFLDQSFDYVVTVCDPAKEACPFFRGGKRYLHKNFEEPDVSKYNEEEILELYKKLIDEIKKWIDETFIFA
jgi:arsenate reductase